MFHLNSINLFNDNYNECISQNISKHEQKKIKKRLKEVNDLLGVSNKSPHPFHLSATPEKIVSILWNHIYKAVNLFLSSGLIVWIFFEPGDYTSINYVYLEKVLIGKIRTEHIVDLIITNDKILISYTDSKVKCIHIGDHKKEIGPTIGTKKWFKLKTRSIKIVEHEIEVNCIARRVEKHLIVDSHHSNGNILLLVWWQNGFNTVCPWSLPITSSKDFSNVFIYNLSKESFELTCFASIPNDILKISFSRSKPNCILTIEDENKPRSLMFKEYKLEDNDFPCLSIVTCIKISIPTRCLKAEFNLSQDKVLLLCEYRTILLYNIYQSRIPFFKAPINAIDLVCSPTGSFFVISDSSGQIMMYDYGLHVMSANYDDLYFNKTPGFLSQIQFLNESLLCLRFNETQNIVLIALPPNLDYINLITSYVKHDCINEALENLQTLDWNINPYLAYSSLNIIFNHLMKEPLNPIRESQLETVLGCFFNPKIPFGEDILEEYKYEMHCLAKRFFYHLYRYSCLDKAFLLALDLKSRHPFLLLYKLAKERGNHKLAEVSLQNVEKLGLHINQRRSLPNDVSNNIKDDTEMNNNNALYDKPASNSLFDPIKSQTENSYWDITNFRPELSTFKPKGLSSYSLSEHNSNYQRIPPPSEFCTQLKDISNDNSNAENEPTNIPYNFDSEYLTDAIKSGPSSSNIISSSISCSSLSLNNNHQSIHNKKSYINSSSINFSDQNKIHPFQPFPSNINSSEEMLSFTNHSNSFCQMEQVPDLSLLELPPLPTHSPNGSPLPTPPPPPELDFETEEELSYSEKSKQYVISDPQSLTQNDNEISSIPKSQVFLPSSHILQAPEDFCDSYCHNLVMPSNEPSSQKVDISSDSCFISTYPVVSSESQDMSSRIVNLDSKNCVEKFKSSSLKNDRSLLLPPPLPPPLLTNDYEQENQVTNIENDTKLEKTLETKEHPIIITIRNNEKTNNSLVQTNPIYPKMAIKSMLSTSFQIPQLFNNEVTSSNKKIECIHFGSV